MRGATLAMVWMWCVCAADRFLLEDTMLWIENDREIEVTCGNEDVGSAMYVEWVRADRFDVTTDYTLTQNQVPMPDGSIHVANGTCDVCLTLTVSAVDPSADGHYLCMVNMGSKVVISEAYRLTCALGNHTTTTMERDNGTRMDNVTTGNGTCHMVRVWWTTDYRPVGIIVLIFVSMAVVTAAIKCVLSRVPFVQHLQRQREALLSSAHRRRHGGKSFRRTLRETLRRKMSRGKWQDYVSRAKKMTSLEETLVSLTDYFDSREEYRRSGGGNNKRKVLFTLPEDSASSEESDACCRVSVVQPELNLRGSHSEPDEADSPPSSSSPSSSTESLQQQQQQHQQESEPEPEPEPEVDRDEPKPEPEVESEPQSQPEVEVETEPETDRDLAKECAENV